MIKKHKNPLPCVDAIIYDASLGVVLIQRKNPPYGWALPGGFVEYGESVEDAVKREALEETGLQVNILGLVGVYSQPGRDPRQHTITTVFATKASNPQSIFAGSDASLARFYPLSALPDTLAFDHATILQDFTLWLAKNII